MAKLATALLASLAAACAAWSQPIEITCYDDGTACPGRCDAHVVVHPSLNGTLHAHRPGSSEAAPADCVVGEPCELCFSEARDSCLVTTYRGSGPPPRVFDFTPEYFASNCGRAELPEPMRTHCAALRARLDSWARRTNCFETPDAERCREPLRAAAAAKADDAPYYAECRALGLDAFNAKYAEQPEKQRANDCLYEKIGSGRSGAGATWRRLLPAACPDGSFVGRSGFDCCSPSEFAAACFDDECAAFFPNP